MREYQVIFCLGVLMILSGCAVTMPATQQMHTTMETEDIILPPKVDNGSIYQTGYDVALFEDLKARRVGDILTIVLVEQTNASKSASTSTSKTNDIGVTAPTIFGLPVTKDGDQILGTSLESDKSFEGEGDSSQSNQLSGRITVTVMEVYQNGYLRIEGEKVITINQGDEYVRLSGIVRPSDITPDNTVLSTQIANAKIAYGGRGVVADANDMGWAGKFFNSKWWPF